MYTALSLQNKNHVMGLSHVFFNFTRSLPSLRHPGVSPIRDIHRRAGFVRLNASPRPPYRIEQRPATRLVQLYPHSRYLSWIPKLTMRHQDQFNGPNDNQEEVAKVAILEKAMKGRQPTDLMLRCESTIPLVFLLTYHHMEHRHDFRRGWYVTALFALHR